LSKKRIKQGERFGRLIALEEVSSTTYYHEKDDCFKTVRRFNWLCDCGNEKVIRLPDVLSGNTRSCSCLEIENRDRINRDFVENEIWNHENALLFHERDRIEKGTKITTLRRNRTNKNNKSGIRGVCWDKSRNKWSVEIMIKGKKIHLGRFERMDNAIKARRAAEAKYFKPILDKYDTKILQHT